MQRKVLVIDDDFITRAVIVEQFRQQDDSFEFMEVANGLEAISLLAKLHKVNGFDVFPDIIVVDINMPVVGGPDFLEYFHDLFGKPPRRIQFIAISGELNDQMLQKIQSVKFPVDTIEKPLYKEHFAAIISRAGAERVT